MRSKFKRSGLAMNINIIHLPERIDRMKSLRKELHKQNISEYEIWDGIIDSEITVRGISKAHKRIVQYAKDNCLPEVLIGEDDLHFYRYWSIQIFSREQAS